MDRSHEYNQKWKSMEPETFGDDGNVGELQIQIIGEIGWGNCGASVGSIREVCIPSQIGIHIHTDCIVEYRLRKLNASYSTGGIG